MKNPDEFQGTEAEVNRESARRTRRSFVVGGVSAAAGYGLWRSIQTGKEIGRQSPTMRRTFETDAAISRGVFDERGLAPTYPLSAATELRLNGNAGMAETLKLSSWRLQVAGSSLGAGHPRFAPDITAWEYEFTGDMKPDAQALDVKSAPGNGDKIPPPPDLAPGDKSGAKGGPGTPDAQKSKDAGNNNGAGGDTKPAAPAPAPNTLNPTGAVDSDAGAALAARIAAMVSGQSKKAHEGDDEAGPSYSGLDRHTPGLLLTMADIEKLPFTEHVTQFKCIEGWSQIAHWGGYRLRDFIEAYPPQKVSGRDPKYVYMETPDGDYYGGYDMSACLHPQSLLVTHMHGKPLTQEHGAPLRLFMPIKYGYKNLKRIGLISYTDTKPDDYWTKLGYDWYAGL